MLEYDVDAVLALAEECNVKKDDDVLDDDVSEAKSNRRFSEERRELRHTSGSERLGRGERRFNDALGEGFASGVRKGFDASENDDDDDDDACDYAGEGDCDVDDRDDESGNERVFDDRKKTG